MINVYKKHFVPSFDILKYGLLIKTPDFHWINLTLVINARGMWYFQLNPEKKSTSKTMDFYLLWKTCAKIWAKAWAVSLNKSFLPPQPMSLRSSQKSQPQKMQKQQVICFELRFQEGQERPLQEMQNIWKKS